MTSKVPRDALTSQQELALAQHVLQNVVYPTQHVYLLYTLFAHTYIMYAFRYIYMPIPKYMHKYEH